MIAQHRVCFRWDAHFLDRGLRQCLVLGYVRRADGARLGEPPVKHKLPRRSCEELLLLQPHGFEGLRWFSEGACPLCSVTARPDKCTAFPGRLRRRTGQEVGAQKNPAELPASRSNSGAGTEKRPFEQLRSYPPANARQGKIKSLPSLFRTRITGTALPAVMRVGEHVHATKEAGAGEVSVCVRKVSCRRRAERVSVPQRALHFLSLRMRQ